MYDDNFDYRYTVNRDGTVSRGLAYRLPSDWTADSWDWYWEGDHSVAFIEEGYRGTRAVTDNPDTERALAAYRSAVEFDADPHEAIDRVAQRIAENRTAKFIHVTLDYGTDLYALSWGGDNPQYRDEIEAVYNGDIYRIETWDYDPDNAEWLPADEVCDEWYGYDNAVEGFEAAFELAAFPAERFIPTNAA